MEIGSFTTVDDREKDGSSFSVEAYLLERAKNSRFTMAEIGHDSLPVAYQQPFEFRGQRAYFGIEVWLRDPIGSKHERIKELRETVENGQNVIYLDHNPGGIVERDGYAEEGGHSWYVGEYDAQSILPDTVVKEVFVSNVFSDKHVACSQERTAALLKEAVRILQEDGVIILRETISPENMMYLTEELIQEMGLQVEEVVEPDDQERWQMLETIYKAEPANVAPQPGSCYLFLSKAVASRER